jgi:hypothetical protein
MVQGVIPVDEVYRFIGHDAKGVIRPELDAIAQPIPIGQIDSLLDPLPREFEQNESFYQAFSY